MELPGGAALKDSVEAGKSHQLPVAPQPPWGWGQQSPGTPISSTSPGQQVSHSPENHQRQLD